MSRRNERGRIKRHGRCRGLILGLLVLLGIHLRRRMKRIAVPQLPTTTSNKPPGESKFLIFTPLDGQGIGNHMNGLLAAHMLGREFHRHVCVSPDWNDFHRAFVPQDSTLCSTLDASSNSSSSRDTVYLITFAGPVNECQLKQQLSSDTLYLEFIANTYPRWAPVGSLQWPYTPTRELQALLPNPFPETVVHLRHPDGDGDARRGLDSKSLQLLNDLVSSSRTHLVTNNVDYYSLFPNWTHPPWKQPLVHSALGISWGKPQNQTDDSKDDSSLNVWSDWYTLLKSQRVYHTHSDFSLSAIHWSDIRDSKTIHGIDDKTGQLVLLEEPWRRDGESIPLVEREGSNLFHCGADNQ